MRQYILKRLLIAVPTVLGVTIIVFILIRVVPGDPLVVFYDPTIIKLMTPEERELLLEELGLSDPLYLQYFKWLGDALQGDLGGSFFAGDEITKVLRTRGIISAEIGLLSVAIGWILGLPTGIVSALKPNSKTDGAASFGAVFFLALPNFWFALMIIVVTVTWFGYAPPAKSVQFWQDPWANLEIVVPPAIVLGTGQAAIIARMARSSLFEVFREDYVRTARSKGLRERVVLMRHALPNALLPVLTLSGLALAVTLGGSLAVEKAFGTPGIGNEMVKAIQQRNVAMVQGLTLVFALVFVGVNLLIDLSYAWIDPRIRLED